MSITPQAVFLYLGIAALVVAVVSVGMAAYTFFHEDIRGVMDDLSGRRRAAEVGMGRGRRRVRAGGRRRAADTLGAPAPAGPGGPGAAAQASSVVPSASPAHASPSRVAPARPEASSPAAGQPIADDEDTAETIVDEDLGVARRPLGVDFGRPVEEDDVLTQVASDVQDDLDATVADAGTPEEPTTRAVPSGSANGSLFRVTRRIISVSSPEVISER